MRSGLLSLPRGLLLLLFDPEARDAGAVMVPLLPGGPHPVDAVAHRSVAPYLVAE